MAAHNHPHSQVFRPANLQELFSLLNRFPGATAYAGGTKLMRSGSESSGWQGVYRELPELPKEILSLERIEELRGITRTERYLEIGAMVRLNEILALGKIVPSALSQTIQGIAGPMVRNMATIGGNIFSAGDTTAALCALDAACELRGAGGSRWVSAIRFSTVPEICQKGELLTRIRVPLEDWNYTLYRKFSKADSGNEGGVLILVAINKKNLLANINVVFSGRKLLRDKDSEFSLEGKALPLDKRDAAHYRKLWEAYLEELERQEGELHNNTEGSPARLAAPGPLLKDKILNAIETGIMGLSD